MSNLIRSLILLFAVLMSGCNSDEEGFHPDIENLMASPNPVVAGEVSTITFRLVPRSNNDVFQWDATVDPQSAVGGFLDVSAGRIGPNQPVTIHFHSKNPTIEEDAAIHFNAWDPALPPSSSNKGRIYSLYIKVIP